VSNKNVAKGKNCCWDTF